MSAAEKQPEADVPAIFTPAANDMVKKEPEGVNLDGWETIPAGRATSIRANADFIKSGEGKPYLICLPGRSDYVGVDEVVINGPSAMCMRQVASWCGNSHVWLETRAEVKYLRTNPNQKRK